MKKLAVFDLDGTLCYTIKDIAIAVNYSLKKNGFPEQTEAYVKSTVGNSVNYMIRHCAPEGEEEAVYDRVLADYMDYYGKHGRDNVKLYPGIPEALAALKQKGLLIAVVSNKPHRDTRRMISSLFPEGTFAAILGMMPRFRRKPDAEPLDFLLDYVDVSKENTVYIGDSEVDIRFAANAGVDCISCEWGYRTIEELNEAGATILSENPGQLIQIIENM